MSADSRQCYKELNIGVARPTAAQLSQVKHHFIAEISIHQNFTVADYEKYADAKLKELFAHSDTVVVVGGSGLYLQALCYGLDDIPYIDSAFALQADQMMNSEAGIDEARRLVARADPEFAGSEMFKNPRRVQRVLEVLLATGKPISAFQNKDRKLKTDYRFILISLLPKRDTLLQNIRHRTDDMFVAGLELEANNLAEFRHLRALQTVGYREFYEADAGKYDVGKIKENIVRNTYQYARRQITWFKNKGSYELIDPAEKNVADYVGSKILHQ